QRHAVEQVVDAGGDRRVRVQVHGLPGPRRRGRGECRDHERGEQHDEGRRDAAHRFSSPGRGCRRVRGSDPELIPRARRPQQRSGVPWRARVYLLVVAQAAPTAYPDFQTATAYHRGMPSAIRVGTCSWADESLTKYFYPPGVKGAEGRLRYYADLFDVVESNSTYYRLPDEQMVQHWAERTPEGFVMHVKAFGVMTRHPVKVEQLPNDLPAEAPLDKRGRVERPSREFRAEIFKRFHDALSPLRDTRKLGGILMQLPPYV